MPVEYNIAIIFYVYVTGFVKHVTVLTFETIFPIVSITRIRINKLLIENS